MVELLSKNQIPIYSSIKNRIPEPVRFRLRGGSSYARHRYRVWRMFGRYAALIPPPELMHDGPPFDDADAYEQGSKLWANSSLAMKQVLSARGIPYFHFIQPNQYYPTRRRFSNEEAKIAFSEGNAGKEVVPRGYSSLLARLSFLRQSGVSVFDLSTVFDEQKDDVYIDNCCHYTRYGNAVFASQVAETITKQLNELK